MSKQEVTIDKCIGLRLTDVVLNSKNEQAVLIFGDVFACVEAVEGFGHLKVEGADLDVFSFGDALMLDKELISVDDLQGKWAQREEAAEKAEEDRARKEFLNSKGKFGNQESAA